jgi:hypothetical protein
VSLARGDEGTEFAPMTEGLHASAAYVILIRLRTTAEAIVHVPGFMLRCPGSARVRLVAQLCTTRAHVHKALHTRGSSQADNLDINVLYWPYLRLHIRDHRGSENEPPPSSNKQQLLCSICESIEHARCACAVRRPTAAACWRTRRPLAIRKSSGHIGWARAAYRQHDNGCV